MDQNHTIQKFSLAGSWGQSQSKTYKLVQMRRMFAYLMSVADLII